MTASSGTSRAPNPQAHQPSPLLSRGWRDIALRVKADVAEDRMVLSAAGVAFFGFLAVVPALAAVVSVAGLVLSPDTVQSRTDQLFANLPTEARDLLTAQLESVSGRAGATLSISLAVSLALSLWSASSGMGHLVDGVNVAYDERDRRNFLIKRALAIVFTLGAVLFVVFALFGLTALPGVMGALHLPGWARAIVSAAFWLLLVLGFVSALGVLYRYGPQRERPRWRWVSWGSSIAAGLWIMTTVMFKLYAANFGSYDKAYGSLAAVVVLLTWLFLTVFVVLLGAEINAELERRAGEPVSSGSATSS